LFKNAIRGVPGKNFSVNWEITVGDGAVPNLVIAFALAVKITSVRRRIRFTSGEKSAI
jgi:hypothetical protein